MQIEWDYFSIGCAYFPLVEPKIGFGQPFLFLKLHLWPIEASTFIGGMQVPTKVQIPVFPLKGQWEIIPERKKWVSRVLPDEQLSGKG